MKFFYVRRLQLESKVYITNAPLRRAYNAFESMKHCNKVSSLLDRPHLILNVVNNSLAKYEI